MNEHESGFLEFLEQPFRGRMKTLLEIGSKRRRDVVSLLHHAAQLDPRFSFHLTGNDAFPASVEAELRKRGAPSHCYVLSAGDLDDREVPLPEALDSVSGMGNGAFLSCIPGRLGYYEYGNKKSAYLLVR